MKAMCCPSIRNKNNVFLWWGPMLHQFTSAAIHLNLIKVLAFSKAYVNTDIDLFGDQNELIEALLKLNKPTTAVLIHGRPLSPQLLAAKCPAILDAFYPGEEGGHALARLLFGDVNPRAKLFKLRSRQP